MTDAPVLMVEASGGRGGPPTTLLHLATEMSKRRPVTVAIRPGEILTQLRERGVDVVELAPRLQGNRVTRRLRTVAPLRRALAGSPLLHLNGKSALNLIGPAVLSTTRRPQAIVHFHDSQLTGRGAAQIDAWRRLRIRPTWVPVSNLAADVLDEDHVGPMTAPIGNPIEVLSTHASFNADSPRVAFVGSSTPNKGLDLMVEIAHRLRDTPITWHVYGSHPQRTKSGYFQGCVARIDDLGLTDRIVWEGRQPQLPHLLVGYQACLVASRRESFCRVALEAMSAGLPVVAGAIPGLIDAVGEGNCRLYDLDDPDRAAQHLIDVVTDRSLFDQFQLAGLERSAAFAPERVCDQFEALYASVQP
jgi:glycosyltransferase involved in cell wall biosynthesis